MSKELETFVDKAKEQGLSNDDIKALLLDSGWSRAAVVKALYKTDLDVPIPTAIDASVAPRPLESNRPTNDPIAVVQNLSTRGFEYSIMFASLWASAFSVGYMLHVFINNVFYSAPNRGSYYSYSESQPSYAFPITVLLVTLPVFVFMFLRLKRAELEEPSLKKDPSRKRLSHLTQFISFLFGIGYLIFFINSLLSGDTGRVGASSTGELFLHTLVTLVIAGSIFAYYWIDEHRANK